MNNIEDWKFLDDMLLKVSRTFAINISFLDEDTRKAVLLSYLFCRILDTIEDSNILSCTEKIAALDLWAANFPFGENKDELIKSTEFLISKGELTDNPYELELLSKNEIVFSNFYQCSQDMQNAVIPWVKEMALGMAKFQKKAKDNEKENYCIKDFKELENYCYYVAGTVGLLLRDIFKLRMKNIHPDNLKILEDNAVAFGLGLQVTNIIKDFFDDSERDWCFIPQDILEANGLTAKTLTDSENTESVKEVLNTLINKTALFLDQALEFSLAIPKEYKDLRIFCLLPLHFAIQTLETASKWQGASSGKIKITRNSVKRTVVLTKFLPSWDFFHKKFYNYYRKGL